MDETAKAHTRTLRIDADLDRRLRMYAGSLRLTVQQAIVALLRIHVPEYPVQAPVGAEARRCDHTSIGLPGCTTCDLRPHKTGMTSAAKVRPEPRYDEVYAAGMAALDDERTGVVEDDLDPILSAAGIAPSKGEPK